MQESIARRAWLHGEALCPVCRLPLDAGRDLERYELDPSGRPVTAVGTHTRCGSAFRLELTDQAHENP